MAIHPHPGYPHPLLKKCHEVTGIDREIHTLIQDLLDTMRGPGSVGVAASQIGVTLRVTWWTFQAAATEGRTTTACCV